MTRDTEEAAIRTSLPLAQRSSERAAQLDSEHVGDIRGGFGTIFMKDTGPRTGWSRVKTLLAILGPGLIVMVGDNDAGAFGTYTQAGQNYGTTLLWTLLLLVPVLYVNQEMVLRLGAVTGVGHARLIFERFGKFWGAFSVIDLFLLNALTIVTEFIGITLGARLPRRARKTLGRRRRGLVIMARRQHRQFPRASSVSRWCCACGSLLLVPMLLHGPPAGRPDRARSPRAAAARGRQAQRRDAADHRHRRHDGRALAAVLPAELRHRQAHHAALHQYEKARSVASASCSSSSAPSR